MLKMFALASLPKAQRETLLLFGVQAQDLIEGEEGIVCRFRSLTASLIPSLYSPILSTARFLYQGLALQRKPKAGGAGYFLERSQTHRGRAIANLAELAEVLSEFRILTIRRPELSVAEQNALFSEAGIIICPFGTDLVTKFQVRPGTDLIVLQLNDLESVYAGIADYIVRYCAILGIRLHLIDCRLNVLAGKIKYHGDMFVDCAALREALLKIEARRGRTPRDSI